MKKSREKYTTESKPKGGTCLAFEIKMSELHSNNEQMCAKLSLGRIFTSTTILGDKNHKGLILKMNGYGNFLCLKSSCLSYVQMINKCALAVSRENFQVINNSRQQKLKMVDLKMNKF